MRFVLDEHVGSALRTFLIEQGHEVFNVRDELGSGADDPEIVALAHHLRAVVITWNRKHFRSLVSREPTRRTTNFPEAGLISCHCRPADAIRLFEQYLPVIEFEHTRRQAMDDRRIIVEIDQNRFTLR